MWLPNGVVSSRGKAKFEKLREAIALHDHGKNKSDKIYPVTVCSFLSSGYISKPLLDFRLQLFCNYSQMSYTFPPVKRPFCSSLVFDMRRLALLGDEHYKFHSFQGGFIEEKRCFLGCGLRCLA